MEEQVTVIASPLAVCNDGRGVRALGGVMSNRLTAMSISGSAATKSDTIRVGQIEIRFLMEAADSGGAVAMFEFMVPAGARVPVPHSHERYDETIYGLEGVLTFVIDGEKMNVGPGKSCFIPRGVVHGFNNLGETAAKGLAIVTPGLLGPEFFRECAEIINPAPPGPPAPADLAKLNAVFAKHGLVAALPSKSA